MLHYSDFSIHQYESTQVFVNVAVLMMTKHTKLWRHWVVLRFSLRPVLTKSYLYFYLKCNSISVKELQIIIIIENKNKSRFN